MQENLPLVVWVGYEVMSSGLQVPFKTYLEVFPSPSPVFVSSLVAYSSIPIHPS